MKASFGIDFGSTNTRVAYFNGSKVRMVAFQLQDGGKHCHIPTAIAYHRGVPVAVGYEAQLPPRGTLFPESLKWILDRDEPIEADGLPREPVDIVADFLRKLRDEVTRNETAASLDKAAVTIPVNYSPRARTRLETAFDKAGIKVTHFFFEPIAAIYTGLIGNPVSGVAAVFDWGGGSLDIATVRIKDGIALTSQLDGWHRGGNDFDELITRHVINDFLSRNPAAGDYTADQLRETTAARKLKSNIEPVKIKISELREAPISFLRFVNGLALNYKLQRKLFDELIASDVRSGITRLERALRASNVTPRTLARLFLSGGTCNIPAIKDRLRQDIAAHNLVSSLRLPKHLTDDHAQDGLNDISNATAIGAALLAAYGTEPVFASSIGVRLSGDLEQFYPVFKANERLDFDQPRSEKFFVTDARSGVARLLICDQDDPVLQPSGRLLRAISIPIKADENWIEVRFTLDRHLTLKIEAAGEKDLRRDHAQQPLFYGVAPHWVQSLNLGFRLPEFTS